MGRTDKEAPRYSIHLQGIPVSFGLKHRGNWAGLYMVNWSKEGVVWLILLQLWFYQIQTNPYLLMATIWSSLQGIVLDPRRWIQGGSLPVWIIVQVCHGLLFQEFKETSGLR